MALPDSLVVGLLLWAGVRADSQVASVERNVIGTLACTPDSSLVEGATVAGGAHFALSVRVFFRVKVMRTLVHAARLFSMGIDRPPVLAFFFADIPDQRSVPAVSADGLQTRLYASNGLNATAVDFLPAPAVVLQGQAIGVALAVAADVHLIPRASLETLVVVSAYHSFLRCADLPLSFPGVSIWEYALVSVLL